MKAGRKTDHPTSGAGETCWSGPSLALHLSVLTMGQGLTCTRKAIAIFERMFYNPLHTEWKQATELKGKGNFVEERREDKRNNVVDLMLQMNDKQLEWFITQALAVLNDKEPQPFRLEASEAAL